MERFWLPPFLPVADMAKKKEQSLITSVWGRPRRIGRNTNGGGGQGGEDTDRGVVEKHKPDTSSKSLFVM